MHAFLCVTCTYVCIICILHSMLRQANSFYYKLILAINCFLFFFIEMDILFHCWVLFVFTGRGKELERTKWMLYGRPGSRDNTPLNMTSLTEYMIFVFSHRVLKSLFGVPLGRCEQVVPRSPGLWPQCSQGSSPDGNRGHGVLSSPAYPWIRNEQDQGVPQGMGNVHLI